MDLGNAPHRRMKMERAMVNREPQTFYPWPQETRESPAAFCSRWRKRASFIRLLRAIWSQGLQSSSLHYLVRGTQDILCVKFLPPRKLVKLSANTVELVGVG